MAVWQEAARGGFGEGGERRIGGLAPADALGYYAQALDLSAKTDDPDPFLDLELAIGLGTAQRQTGDPAFRDTLLDVARRAADLSDTERLVAAVLANDRGWHSAAGVVDTDKVEMLESALDRLPTNHPNRALVLATLCSELIWGSAIERREALADEAIAIANSTGDDATIVRVLNHTSYPLLARPLLEQSQVRAADALTRAKRVGDPVLLFFAAMWRGIVAGCAGEIEEMDRCYEITGSLAEELGQPTLSWAHASLSAVRAQIAGDSDRVEQLATEALQIGTDSGQPDAPMYYGSHLAMAHWERGTMGDLVPLIEQMAADNPGLPTLKA